MTVVACDVEHDAMPLAVTDSIICKNTDMINKEDM